MTREQAREAAAVMLAWADGKEVEYRYKKGDGLKYNQSVEPLFNWEYYDYRLKPATVLRPWTADEVPLGAWMRNKINTNSRSLIVSADDDAYRRAIFQGYEHSTDGGKTWKPCGVEEVGK